MSLGKHLPTMAIDNPIGLWYGGLDGDCNRWVSYDAIYMNAIDNYKLSIDLLLKTSSYQFD
jgi:hypothetical protein